MTNGRLSAHRGPPGLVRRRRAAGGRAAPTSSGTSARCPPCRAAALQREARTDRAARPGARADRHPLPPGLRSRCEALAREHATRPPRHGFALRRFAPLTAVLTVVIGFVLFSLATHQSDTVLAAQLTADHAKCFRSLRERAIHRTTTRGASSRCSSTTTAGTCTCRRRRAPNGVHLIGARRCLYADGPVPHVMYRVERPGCVTLCAGRRQRGPTPAISSRSAIVRASGPRPQDLRAGVARGRG